MLRPDTSDAAGARFYLISAVLGSVWVILFLRIWICITRSFTYADGLCLLSAILFTGFCATAILIKMFHKGQANDASHASLENSLSMAGTELYLFAMAILKLSVASFYLRYIEDIWQRYATYAALLINTASSSLAVIVTPLECGILLGQTQSTKFYACTSVDMVQNAELATSIVNAATSWALAIIPIFIIASRTKRMSTATKVCIGCVLLLGGCASVMSLARVIFIVRSSMGLGKYLVPLSILECGTAIIAASAATLRPHLQIVPTPTGSRYVTHTQSEKNLEPGHEDFGYDSAAPSKSHFSLFSEASFGPKTWFKGLHDTTSGTAPDDERRLQRNKGGVSHGQSPIRKTNISQLAMSHPTINASPRPPRIPLNRAESHQHLLRNKNGAEPSVVASRRHAGSPSLFLTYGAVERHV